MEPQKKNDFPPPVIFRQRQMVTTLSNGPAWLVWTEPLTPDDVEDLRDCLQLQLKVIARCYGNKTPAPAPEEEHG